MAKQNLTKHSIKQQVKRKRIVGDKGQSELQTNKQKTVRQSKQELSRLLTRTSFTKPLRSNRCFRGPQLTWGRFPLCANLRSKLPLRQRHPAQRSIFYIIRSHRADGTSTKIKEKTRDCTHRVTILSQESVPESHVGPTDVSKGYIGVGVGTNANINIDSIKGNNEKVRCKDSRWLLWRTTSVLGRAQKS